MTFFFTSDTHFFHANIIKYCKRPYSNAFEMNDALIENWNDVVSDEDTIWHLGDFAFANDTAIKGILCQLKGHKHLVLGNHDEKRIGRHVENFIGPDLFESITEGFVQRKFEGQRMILCHYAMRVWNRSHHGAWHLYGHSHGTLPDDPHALSMDVGVDPNSYRPINMDQIALHMSLKDFRPVDHHGE